MVKWPFSRRVRGLGEPPDYYREGLKLANEQKFHEALTSFRLALRANPDNHEIMQQMAVIYTHIGMPDEAVKYYEEAIRAGGDSAAAHYGLAFLCLRRGDQGGARRHLDAFLRHPPSSAEASEHIEHARRTLQQLEAGEATQADSDEQAGE